MKYQVMYSRHRQITASVTCELSHAHIGVPKGYYGTEQKHIHVCTLRATVDDIEDGFISLEGFKDFFDRMILYACFVDMDYYQVCDYIRDAIVGRYNLCELKSEIEKTRQIHVEVIEAEGNGVSVSYFPSNYAIEDTICVAG